MQATYILPLKNVSGAPADDLAAYLNAVPIDDLIVVDSSPADCFRALDALLHRRIVHVPPAPDIRGANGKVVNVLTGLRRARHERVIVADDDVRYDEHSLRAVLAALTIADIVRPQNYFSRPLAWHALFDTGRTLINRALDGDWPGTLAFYKRMLPHGYNADVLFENFELVRTVRARGGSERVARDIYVLRLPPTARHFWSQRVRQAYDEFARPARLCIALALLPLSIASIALHAAWAPAAILLASAALAAFGRARDGGRAYFPAAAVAAAPIWVLERAICAWLAVYERIAHGGVRYAGGVLRDAASRATELHRWAA